MPSTELRVQQWRHAMIAIKQSCETGGCHSSSSSDETLCSVTPFVDWLLITGDARAESTSARHKSRRAMSQHQVRSILKFVGVKPQLATEACNAVFNILLCATLGLQTPLSPCNECESSTFSAHEKWEKAVSASHVKAFRQGELVKTSNLRSIEALEALTLVDPEVDLFLVLPFAALLHIIRDVLKREKIVGALNLRGPISSEIAAAAAHRGSIIKMAAAVMPKATTGAARTVDDVAASSSPLNMTQSLLQHDHRILFATKLQQHKTPLIIFVGGTSGCGKSTLAHLLANRLGISTVISTDGLREILRGHRDRDQAPELFASTYEAHLKRSAHQSSSSDMSSMTTGASSGSVGGTTPSSPNPAQLLPPIDKRVIDSFVQQSSSVLEVLDEVLTQYIDRCEAVLVEGVHLLPSYCIRRSQALADRGVLCIPLFVHIVNREKHLLRFAIRAKSMTLKPKENKYVAHFAAIRQIQGYIEDAAAKSDLFLVNNTNVDKSLSAIHYVVLRSVDLMSEGRRNATNGSFTPSSRETSLWSSVKGKQMVEVLMRRREEKRSRRTRSAEPPASQQQGGSSGTLPKISVGETHQSINSEVSHKSEGDEPLRTMVTVKEKVSLSVSDVVYRRSPGARSPTRPFHQPPRSHSADAQLSRGRKSRDRQPRSIIPGVDDADDDGEGCEEEYGTTEGGKTAEEVLIEASRMKRRHTGEGREQRDDSIDDEEREEDAPSLIGS